MALTGLFHVLAPVANNDRLNPAKRCASTSNRFEGRQGREGRTHLVSPAMAAAAAVTGHFADIRQHQIRKLPPPGEIYPAYRHWLSRWITPTRRLPIHYPKQFCRRLRAPVLAPICLTTRRFWTKGSTAKSGIRVELSGISGGYCWRRGKKTQLRLVTRARAVGVDTCGFKVVIAPSFADIFYGNSFAVTAAGNPERRTGR